MAINLFDANFYRSANSELNGMSDSQAWSHFNEYGLENGLEFSSLVDLDFYRASNSDLAELDNKQAYDHLASYGISQGLKFSSLVDLDFYQESNSELANLDNEGLFEDLKNRGLAAGDSFSPFVSVDYYLADNADIAQEFGNSYTQAFDNLVIEGLNGGYSFSPAFDAEFYKNAHTDLAASSLDNEQLLEHFVLHGLNEGRASAPGFDVRHYLDNNSSLNNFVFTYRDAYEHFVTTGLKNGLDASGFIESDSAGNSLESARAIAASKGEIVFRDSIGSSDTDDFYSLSLNNPNSNLGITVNGLSADVDVELLNSSGEIVSRAASNSNINESLNVNHLQAGDYYIRVFQGIELSNSNYNLSLSVTPIDTEAKTIVLNESPSVGANPASATTVSAASSPTINPLIEEVVVLTNSYRAQYGLQPLALNANLSTSAQVHSEDMALSDFFGHAGSDGSRVRHRAQSAGYESSYVGENIAAGYITAEEVVRGWMNSPSHRDNILNPNYTEIGVGYHYLANDTGEINYNTYWTQNFGS